MDIGELILDPRAAPVWAVVGGIVVKVVDWIVSRHAKKAHVETSHMRVITEANKQLIGSLLAQVESLSKMTADLQAELRETHRALDEKIERVLQLEEEVIILRREAQVREAQAQAKDKPSRSRRNVDLTERGSA